MTAEDEVRRQHNQTRDLIVASERRIHACVVSTVAVAALSLAALLLALGSALMVAD